MQPFHSGSHFAGKPETDGPTAVRSGEIKIMNQKSVWIYETHKFLRGFVEVFFQEE